jgi:hypothetical protein
MLNSKGDIRLRFQENIFFRQAAPPSKKQLKYFSNTNNSTILTPSGLQGCLEKKNCPLSSNLTVWCAKIRPKTQKLQKTVKKPSFFVVFLFISEIFQTFKLLGPILAHQTTKFELSG